MRITEPGLSSLSPVRSHSARTSLAWGLLCAVLLALLTVVMPGCGGCRKSDEAAEKKKKEDVAKQKKKKPVDVSDLETLPSDDTDTRNFVKPGHMVTAWVGARANLEDLRAEFETSVANGSGRPIFIGNTRYHLVTSRPAVLPKGQQKYLETTYFIPVETEKNASSVFLQHKLKSVSGGGIVDEASQIAQLLPNYQYLLAVLSANPNAFGYLKQMEAVKPSYDELRDDLTPTVYYRVVLPPIREQAPLPSHPLAWTMLAYVLWDGMQPGGMTPSQQTAMIDWLHWGGQLIVSGPGSLDQLAGSFLDPYLPAVAGRTVELGSAAFEELNQTWALTRRKTNERLSLKVQETSPIVGVRLQPRPGAELLAGTGSLVVERRVGRGRVVVTSFPLTHPDVVNWGSFDSFLNACIFRRPSRRFTAAQYGAVRVKWASSNMGVNNPLFLTATRYFTRDVGRYADAAAKDPAAPAQDWHADGCEPSLVSGIGGWNDQSGPSSVAHQTLQDAAGISIPKASFVLGVLAIYLVVLVPVNWGVFRLLGHVEWAWIAAPVIAVLGAIAVIRLAQLDIGFVRSRTEIAVLEAHGGYPRAHLTRYTAFYSSLSSNYQLRFDDTSAFARPFPPTEGPDRVSPVTFRRDKDVQLSGFQVRSNSTGFVHSEQMLPLGGAVSLVGDRPLQWRVRNDSDFSLDCVGVMYRAPDQSVFTCWLDRLPAKSTAELKFTQTVDDVPWLRQWENLRQVAAEKPVTDLTALTELAARGTRLQSGDVRLVGWTDGVVPGLTISPRASQTQARTVVLIHLRHGPLPPPTPDVNLSADVREEDGFGDDLNLEFNPLLPEATEKQ